MTFTASETAFLASQGFTDLLLAYPTLLERDCELIAGLARSERLAGVVVDSFPQVEMLAGVARRGGGQVPLLIDTDVSFRPLGGLHLGVRRSPLRKPAQVVDLAERIARTEGVGFRGLLTYESHLASPRAGPAAGGAGRGLLVTLSQSRVSALRRAHAAALASVGLQCKLVNGGGTGNLGRSAKDPSLTEVSAGSGFLAGHLAGSPESPRLEPALLLAFQVVRQPAPGLVAVHGGGVVASGPAGPDRLPQPLLPPGLSLTRAEGAGEVQTPLLLEAGVKLPLGAPVFFRPARSGEPLELFPEVLLVKGNKVVERVPTYRGLGRSFL